MTSAAQATRNVLQYNSTSSLFSCYTSGQSSVYLYKLAAGPSAPVVTTGTAGTFTTTSAAITGNNVTSDGGSAVTERGIVYNTSATPTTANSKVTVAGTTGSYDANMTGLTAGTTYFVRAYAINAIGTSYGSEISFPTLPSAPVASAATAITSNSFSANWAAATGATKYRLDVSTDNAFGSFVSGFSSLDVGNVTTKSVTGLAVGTTYYYRVRAENGSGQSANSGTITTATTTPTIVITGSFTPFTTTFGTASAAQSISVSGSNLLANITVTAPTNYEVSQTAGGASGYAASQVLTQSGGTVPSTTVYVRIAASAPVGSPAGNVSASSTSATTQNAAVSGTVSAAAPTVTTTSPATNISTTSVTLGGNITNTGGSNATVRGFEYSTTNGFANGSGTPVSESGSFSTGAYTLPVTGLTPGTIYYFKAFATNPGGTSYGAQVSFTTVQAYSGSYSVGTGAPLYTTLKSFFDAVNAGVVTGNITVNIVGDCAESAAAVLNQWTESPASSNFTMLIQPSGGAARTISGSISGNPLVNFNGADNVTINGLNSGGNSLTISNTDSGATSGTSTIKFIGGATNNTITNASVLGSSSMAVGTNGGNIWFSTDAVTSGGNDNNTVSNCNIGPAGANLPTKGIFGSGSTGTTAIGNSGIAINNNNIFDFFGAATTSAGVYTSGGCNTWTITNNRFYQTGTRTWTTGANHFPIDINNTSATSGAQGFTITGNTIGYASNTQTGAYTLTGSTGKFVGIHFNGITGGTSSDISSNTIASVSLSGVTSSGTSTSSPFIGIYIETGVTATNSNVLGSQAVTGSLTFSTTTTTATDVHGIYNFSSDVWTSSSNNIGGISVTNAGASGTFTVYGLRANTLTSVAWTAASNLVGGTVADSIQLNATGAASQVIGIHTSNAPSTLTSNTVRNLSSNIGTGTTTGASVIGMNLTTTSSNHTLSQNTIHSLANTSAATATTVTGIQYTASTGPNLINRNFIHSLSAASTTGTLNGIQVSGGTSTYRNNMIRLGATTSTALTINGINDAAGTNNFYFNSVYVGGSGVGTTASNTFAFRSLVTTNTRAFVDNIFMNARSNATTGGKHYAVQVGGTTSNPAGLTINYNVYFVSGTGGVFGQFNGADVATLTAWRTAVGQDLNSISGDPQFINPTGNATTVDLHISPSVATPVESAGSPIAGITIDFDGDTRNATTPDIGADEGTFISSVTAAINVSPSSLSGFSTNFGTPSAAQSFDVSGTDLTGDISIAAPAGYEVSKTSSTSGFSASQSLTPSSGTVPTTAIFVRLTNAAPVGSVAGNVIVSSPSAATQNVAVSGNVTANAPAVTTGTATLITTTGATLGGNITATGGSNATERGVYYSTTSGFANGTGTKVSTTGSYTTGAYTVAASGLSDSTTYYFKAFATGPGGTSYGSEGTFSTLEARAGGTCHQLYDWNNHHHEHPGAMDGHNG